MVKNLRESGISEMERWNGLLEWTTGMEYWNTLVRMRTTYYSSCSLLAGMATSGSAANPIDLTVDDVLHQGSRTTEVVRSPVKVVPGERFK